MTVNKARHAGLPLRGISNVSALAYIALSTFGVIHTLETISQSHLIWTVAVSIAFAFLLALFPHIAKVTGTSVWSCTSSIHALIMTVWFTFSTERLLQVTFLTGTVVTGLSVCAVLTFVITVMVSIYTLILRGTRSIGPRWSTLGFFCP